VNQALIQIARADDETEQLQFSLPEVNKWLSEWQVSEEEKSAYLKTLVEIYAQNEPCVCLVHMSAILMDTPLVH
jgi:translation initiation factor 3 subunit M